MSARTGRTALLTVCSGLLMAVGGCSSTEPASADAASARDPGAVALGLHPAAHMDGDEAVTLEACPAAVQATIKAHLDGGTIVELERTTDHGEVLYEVDVRGADGVVEFDVAEDGAFRGYDDDGEDGDGDDGDGDDTYDDGDDAGDEHEEEIPPSEVPDVVKAAAIAAMPGIVLEEAERENEGGTVVHELEGEVDGRGYEIEVSADGTVLEIELDDEDDEDDEDDHDD